MSFKHPECMPGEIWIGDFYIAEGHHPNPKFSTARLGNTCYDPQTGEERESLEHKPLFINESEAQLLPVELNRYL